MEHSKLEICIEMAISVIIGATVGTILMHRKLRKYSTVCRVDKPMRYINCN